MLFVLLHYLLLVSRYYSITVTNYYFIHYLYKYVGSGIWQLQGSSYTEIEENEVITLREDVSLVCVTTTRSTLTWYFRGESNTGMGDELTDDIEYEYNRAFLTLNFSQSLPANRTGYYYCLANERQSYLLYSGDSKHFIKIYLPIGMLE